jgi:hypothetical protein
MEVLLIGTLAVFAAYIYHVLRQMKQMTKQLQERERVYYMRVVVSDKNPDDLYSSRPVRGSMIMTSKPIEIGQKINHHFHVTDGQNVFIEHVQPLN